MSDDQAAVLRAYVLKGGFLIFDDFEGYQIGNMWAQLQRALEDNDPTKRMYAIVNHNNDIAEYWEWSDTNELSIDFTNDAYKLGINYVVYAMTH